MSQQELNYADAAAWVLQRTPRTELTRGDVEVAFHSLFHAAMLANADCSIPNMFPECTLEVLFSRDVTGAEMGVKPPAIPLQVQKMALTCIGKAIENHMHESKKAIVQYEVAGIGQVHVYHPASRNAVLLGTNTAVPNAQE